MNIAIPSSGEKTSLRISAHRTEVERFDARIARTSFATHAHEGFVIGVIVSGVQSLVHKGVHHAAPAGSVTFFNPEELHATEALKGHSVHYQTLHVPASLLREIAPPTFTFPVAVLNNTSIARRLSEQLTILDATKDQANWDNLLTDFLYRCTSLFVERPAVQHKLDDPRIRLIQDYIEENITGSLDLDALAEQLGLSKFHFLRLFRTQIGVTPHAYIQARRTARAKRLLHKRPPAEVASLCGFVDQSHLTRWMKSCYGTTPSVYHKQVRSQLKFT